MYHSTFQFPLRTSIKQMLRDLNANFTVTFAYNDHYTGARATQLVESWYCNVMNRLFRRHWRSRPAEGQLQLILLPERQGTLHFHGQVRVAESHLDYFTRVGPRMWRSLVPTGELHYKPVDDTIEKWFNYVTKSELALNDFICLPTMLPERVNTSTP